MPKYHKFIFLQVLQLIGAIFVASIMGLFWQFSVRAAANLTITPITWNVVGLDSNDVSVGPNNFPVGVRVCNTGDTPANNVTTAFVWDSVNTNINLRPGSYGTTGNPAPAVASLAVGACTDFYYEVQITRTTAAYNTVRRYHITATADGLETVSTPVPREIFVERLISQSRNSVTDIQLNGASIPAGGSMNLVVGQTYTIRLSGQTATNGYEQIESFINFPNTIFQILSVASTYSNVSGGGVSPTTTLYNDACTWVNDPNSPNYRSCLATGKAGGTITHTYTVRILSGGGTTQKLNTLIYDFSGSSYHYNGLYDVNLRLANIIDPTTLTIAKSFSPNPTTAGGNSTLILTIHNPNAATISGVQFSDTFPTSPGAMVVANPPAASTTGCGTPTFSPTAGDPSISFSNGSVGPNGDCIIRVNVAVPPVVTGTYGNTTGTLRIFDGTNTIDTGNSASANLVVNNTPVPPAPTCGWPLALWTFPSTMNITAPAPTTSSVTASAAIGAGLTAMYSTDNHTTTPPVTGSWGSNGSFNSTGALNTTYNDYFQFAIDTTGYSRVDLGFWARRPTGNSPTQVVVYYGTSATPPGTLSTTLGSPPTTLFPLAANTWQSSGTISFSSGLNPSGLTYFRVYGAYASQSNPGSDLYLDDVVFTGCKVPNPPTISKTFLTNPVAVNGNSILQFTLTNPNSIPLNGVRFADTLPAGLEVAATPAASTTCGGSPTWAPGAAATSLVFGTPTGASIPANSNCTVQVNVRATTAGPHQNVSGFVSSTESGTNATSSGFATASLTAILPPVIAKSFSPNPILVNERAILTFNLINPNMNNALSGVAFADTYPSGLVNANLTTYPVTNTCGGSITAVTGGNSLSLSGGSISAGSSCKITVSVTSSSPADYANTTGNVSATLAGTGNTATDTLQVDPVRPEIALLKQVGPSSTGPWTSFLAVNPPLPKDVYFRFTVENTGDTALSNVSVNDITYPSLDLSNCGTVLTGGLALYETKTCVSGAQAVSASGTYTNTARAQGDYSSITYYSLNDTVNYATTGLTLVKNATETYFTAANELLHYSYVVTNTGSAPLQGPVTVADDKSTNESCPSVNTVGDLDDFLDPGESITCTATYTTQSEDVNAGYVTNVASATVDAVTSNTATKTLNIDPTAITLVDFSAHWGQQISLWYLILGMGLFVGSFLGLKAFLKKRH